nr:hypothetical protein [Deltaproteobacteria bacterium]
MRTTISSALTLGLIALTACDQAYDPGELAVDPNAPKIRITKPERGEYAGEVGTVTVSGTVHDDVGVTSVTVNGVAATVSPSG